MPSRNALFELATRRNSYVCRSCLTALGLSQPPPRFTRGYARHSRIGRPSSLRQQNAATKAPPREILSNGSKSVSRHFEEPGEPDTAEEDSLWDGLDLEDSTPNLSSNERPKINYFEKDPKTGEVTPIPEFEDDGEDEPDFEDIQELGRSALAKFKTLDAALGKADQLDYYLEKLLEKHGPPGAIEAFRAALKSFDEPSKSEPQSDFNVEEEPDANADNVVGSLMEAISEPKSDDTPELKDAALAVQDTLKSLTSEIEGEASGGTATGDTSNEVAWPNAFEKSAIRKVESRDFDVLPSITFPKDKYSSFQLHRLNRLADDLQTRLRASTAAVRKPAHVRKIRDDATNIAFCMLMSELSKPHTEVDEGIWRALWTIFSHEGPSNPTRMRRIRRLSNAMRMAGAPLSDKQELLAIEAAFEGQAFDVALDSWKRQVTQLGDEETRTTMAYWALGVRMWSAVGDIERAERACKTLFEKSTPSIPADSRVLLHLIQAYCAKAETAEKGFSLYRRMRDFAKQLEKPFEIQDYDDVISIFLHSGHTDYAMFAFTDMMFAGAVTLRGKAHLPNHVRNQFFFGKWLKRLIGANDLDGAYNVLVFMQKNGVMAASIQVNGLIGAWLRTGLDADRAKAYSLARAMIRSRQTFVDCRKRQALLEWPLRLWQIGPNKQRSAKQTRRRGSGVDVDMDYGLVPKATVETFVILAAEYRQRALFIRLEELFVAYKQCEMPGDAMMMNELIAAAVAQRKGNQARELYKLMVHENDVLPTPDTFAILFSSLPVNVAGVPLVNERQKAESTHEARAIFADMISSSWVYCEKPARGRAKRLSENQAKLILHSFRKADDWAGVCGALMGLRDVMGYQLTRGVMLEMVEGVERIDRRSPRMARVVIRATIKLQELVEELQRQGKLNAHLTPEGMKDWKALYTILLSFYHSKLQQSAVEDWGRLLEEAKEEMGLARMTVTLPKNSD